MRQDQFFPQVHLFYYKISYPKQKMGTGDLPAHLGTGDLPAKLLIHPSTRPSIQLWISNDWIDSQWVHNGWTVYVNNNE